MYLSLLDNFYITNFMIYLEYSRFASAKLMLDKVSDMITTDTNEIIHFMAKA